jgi:DNA replication protein DnaC
LTRAFGQKACRDGFTAHFATTAQLFRELALARADGSYAKRLRSLGQVDVLIVDDWAMAPM